MRKPDGEFEYDVSRYEAQKGPLIPDLPVNAILQRLVG
jgi:hypothetical protein